MSKPPKTDRLSKALQDSSEVPNWNALDETILAAARSQAVINSQRSQVILGKPIKTKWQRWGLAGGAGSLAAVLATVLLVTADPEAPKPVVVAADTATAPVSSPQVGTVERAVASSNQEVAASTSKQQPVEVPVAATESVAKAKAAAPETRVKVGAASRADTPAPVAQVTAVPDPVSAPATAPVPPPAPASAPSPASAQIPIPDPAPTPSIAAIPTPAPKASAPMSLPLSARASSLSAPSKSSAESVAWSSVVGCEKALSGFPLDLRSISYQPWFNVARLCKQQFPQHQWPEAAGPMSEVTVQP